jgi:hypothetical protein
MPFVVPAFSRVRSHHKNITQIFTNRTSEVLTTSYITLPNIIHNCKLSSQCYRWKTCVDEFCKQHIQVARTGYKATHKLNLQHTLSYILVRLFSQFVLRILCPSTVQCSSSPPHALYWWKQRESGINHFDILHSIVLLLIIMNHIAQSLGRAL